MSILFLDFAVTIAVVSGYAVATSLVVNYMVSKTQQATVGSVLAVGGIVALPVFLPVASAVLVLLLTMFLSINLPG